MSPDAYIIVALVLSYFYIFLAMFLEHKKWNYIHETAISLVLGAIFGVFLYFFADIFNTTFGETLRQVIFLVLLPPMLFEDGYNIRKRKFFQNIMYANLYGIIGTFLQFLLFVAIISAFSANNLILSAADNLPIVLLNWQILALATVLCSIDTVVPEKIVNPERYPKLFSIIFGESIMKDTFTVTLFDSIMRVMVTNNQTQDIKFAAQQLFYLSGIFLQVVVCSIAIGLMAALITTFIFKQCRFLISGNGIAQVALINLAGYICYIASQWANYSGIISMLFCGITLSHFNTYNLSQHGKASTKYPYDNIRTVISMLALIAQGLLFFLVGAYIFDIQYNASDSGDSIQMQYAFSYIEIALAGTLLFVGRAINIFMMSLFGWFVVGKDKWRLNLYEYQILYVSGLVKGAVPFALILSIPNASTTITGSSLVITVTFLVFITSLFFNCVMPKILRNRLEKIQQLYQHNPTHPSLFDSLIQKKVDQQGHVRASIRFNKFKGTTQKYWRKFEEGWLKPFLIYDYHNRKNQIKMDKLKTRNQEYQAYQNRFSVKSNIIDPYSNDNQFIQVHIEHSSASSDDQHQQKNTKNNIPSRVPSAKLRKEVSEVQIQNFKESQNKKRYSSFQDTIQVQVHNNNQNGKIQ